jgi:phosphatidylinositol alpha-1,6-mannosyltransferase
MTGTLAPTNAFDVADFWFGPRAERSKTREALGLSAEKVTMVTVAPLTRSKGHLATLAALANLHFLVRERLTWLVIGPDGETDYVEELKAAVTASDCDVRIMGALSAQQIRDVYGACDLFCLIAIPDSSKSIEECGLVYLEAAAGGLPSIATAVGDAAHTVIDNETGSLVEPSVESITNAVAELAMDGVKRVSLGKRAWVRVRAMNRNRASAAPHLSPPARAHLLPGLEKAHGHPTAGGPK